MGSKQLTIAALDIGTTNIRALIGRAQQENGIRITGVGIKPSEGVRKGMIINSDEVVKVARAAVETAEQDGKTQVHKLYVSIGGSHIQSSSTGAVLNILDGDETVRIKHITELLEKARSNATEKGREFLHVIPQEYRLDGTSGLLNPEGLKASRVEASMHAITADTTILENHARIVNDSGFHVNDICASIIADGYCVLAEQEKKDGILLVDIGGGTTSYAIYFNNTVYYSNVFGVGGDHVTNDLALGLHLTTSEAEELKKNYSQMALKDSDHKIIKMKTHEQKTKSISRQDVEMIIDSRIEELLRFIYEDIDQRQFRPLLARGVVLVGGSTYLYRFVERVGKVFSMPIRIGVPKVLALEDKPHDIDVYSDRHEELRDTRFATAIGLLKYGARQQYSTTKKRESIIRKIFSLS